MSGEMEEAVRAAEHRGKATMNAILVDMRDDMPVADSTIRQWPGLRAYEEALARLRSEPRYPRVECDGNRPECNCPGCVDEESRSEPATTEREPDGFKDAMYGCTMRALHGPRAAALIREEYSSPPPEQQTRVWKCVDVGRCNRSVDQIKAEARAETLAVIRQALPAMTFKDSWGVDAVYVDSLLAGLDRLSTEGGGS